jgi:hypothetical protein
LSKYVGVIANGKCIIVYILAVFFLPYFLII